MTLVSATRDIPFHRRNRMATISWDSLKSIVAKAISLTFDFLYLREHRVHGLGKQFIVLAEALQLGLNVQYVGGVHCVLGLLRGVATSLEVNVVVGGVEGG